jgi:hypothetical protein
MIIAGSPFQVMADFKDSRAPSPAWDGRWRLSWASANRPHSWLDSARYQDGRQSDIDGTSSDRTDEAERVCIGGFSHVEPEVA